MPETENTGLMLTPSDGPTDPSGSTPRVGCFPAAPVWRYVATGEGREQLVPPFTVEPGTRYRVALWPELRFTEADPDPLPDHSSAAIGLTARALDDATDHPLRDQHHLVVQAGDPGPRVTDQWNVIDLDLTALAGRTITLDLLTHAPGTGWVQPVGTVADPDPFADPLTILVDTRRGSHQTGGSSISRGNTFPATNVPHGFTFLTPVTDARSARWLYSWHGRPTDPDPRPALQALAFSHCPSPWMGDRLGFQVMPWTHHCTLDPLARERHFSHDDESARPHHYRVRLEDGVVAEMAPTSHAGVFRFDFSDTHTAERGVLLDMPGDGELEVTHLHDGRLTFTARIAPPTDWQLDGIDPLPGFIHGETRQPVDLVDVTTREGLPELPGNLGRALTRRWPRWARLPMRRTQAAAMRLREGDVLEVVVGTSMISTQQARHNLALEVGDRSLGDVADLAATQWNGLLERLEITGGTHDQRVSAYSNLVRLYSWPNEAHENRGPSAEQHDFVHADPFSPSAQPASRHQTGAAVRPGRLYVNNGYWDTFRTCWPAYHLLTPLHASVLLDGIVQQYLNGGWMARWSAPGYADCMVGTSSDAIFADASAHGVTFQEMAAYDSALRNACVPADQPAVGRKGIATARFRGWVDTSVPEGFSWSMDNANSDAAIASWSARLANIAGDAAHATESIDPSRTDEFRANAIWFRHRAAQYQKLFDPLTGFFRARDAEGQWRGGRDVDPTLWGRDYTETNAWGMAFHAPFDPAGLARLYGGDDGLAEKLQQALDTPETASARVGRHYGGVIHEMLEARSLRLGQVGMSNQPAHHVPYMFTAAGRHHRTQWLTREILERCFTGSAIGQGYPGDEDNGEMSAWWLLSAMGLYPLAVGSGEMVITAPLFERMAFRRDDDSLLEVTAGNIEHRHIQWVTLNGEPWQRVTIPTWQVHGDIRLHVELGPEPTDWASDTRPVSLEAQLQGGRAHDDLTLSATVAHLTAAGEQQPTRLCDDVGEREHFEAGEAFEARWPVAVPASIYTLTVDSAGAAPVRVEVEIDGAWHPAHAQPRPARWANQTQAHLLHPSGEPIEITALRVVAEKPLGMRQVEVWL